MAVHRFNGRSFAIGALLLALVALTAACGSSSGDPTQIVSGGETVDPVDTPAPTVPAGTPQDVAKQELDTLIRLAQSELTLDRQELEAYAKEVGAVLNRIDSDPDVLEAFKNLLEDTLGVTFVFEDSARLNDTLPGKVGRALPLSGPFKCSAADQDYDPFAGSKAWHLLRCFMDALFDAEVPASVALNAVNPLYAEVIAKFFVRTNITIRCYTATWADFERCDQGEDPVLNKFRQGDIAGAHKIIRKLAPPPESKPRLTLDPAPTQAPTRGPTRTPTEVPTPVPPPTATLPPAITLEPTPVPTPSSGISNFSGTWIGRYSGLYTHGFSICGATIPIEGPITAVLTQTGTLVTGTVTLGGSNVLEISQDSRDGTCRIVRQSEEIFPVSANALGDTLASPAGLPASFRATKTSDNSLEGTTKDAYLDATFFLGRLR